MLAREITLADHDRAQHCCVVGSSGSGKTYGVLIPMVLQDMRRGAGVFNLCVAGDAHDYLVAACPPERMKDLVVLDFTYFTASPGLSLLQFQTKWPRVERGFIVGNLIETFKRQYPDVPEGFGPMFELYFTQAAYLAMEAQGSTVADIIRVFADPVYRRSLLAICRGPSVKVFWTNIAQRAGGEASLENMAPYIICKLTKLLDDEAVRRVVSQAESTLELRALMDNRSICLIKISKGFLTLISPDAAPAEPAAPAPVPTGQTPDAAAAPIAAQLETRGSVVIEGLVFGSGAATLESGGDAACRRWQAG